VSVLDCRSGAEGLGVSWNTANDAVLAEGRRVLIEDPHRFDSVRVIGVDEHCWRHTRRGDKYVTVIIDLTPIRDGTGPARLLERPAGHVWAPRPQGRPALCRAAHPAHRIRPAHRQATPTADRAVR
jgi:hypothetical protein